MKLLKYLPYLILILVISGFVIAINKSGNSPVKKTEDTIDTKLSLKKNNFSLKEEFSQAYTVDQEMARSYIAIDADSGGILLEKNSDKPFAVASLTKVMTAIIALDLADQNESFLVSQKASRITPTRIGVIPGQKMTVAELLNAMLLTSANDAAQVIREGIDSKYKSPVFIEAMNKKAEIIGLKNTRFDNPQGFDGQNNYSTAGDLAVLSRYALYNYPLISEIVQKDYEFLPANQNHKQFDLYNWNGLIGVYPGAIGMKIGNTERAGTTSIVAAERNGKKIIAVILGTNDVLQRDLLGAQLLDEGFKEDGNLSYANITSDQLLYKYSTWKYWN